MTATRTSTASARTLAQTLPYTGWGGEGPGCAVLALLCGLCCAVLALYGAAVGSGLHLIKEYPEFC
jgi:hypothetical protein